MLSTMRVWVADVITLGNFCWQYPVRAARRPVSDHWRAVRPPSASREVSAGRLSRARQVPWRGLAMRRRSSSANPGTPARPRVARSRGVSGGLRVRAACSRITCRMVGGLRSSWSRRKSSGWTASSPSGASAAAGKSFALAVMMACAPPRIAAASTCRSSWSGRDRPASSLPSRRPARRRRLRASARSAWLCRFRGGSPRWPLGPRRGCGRTTAGGTGPSPRRAAACRSVRWARARRRRALRCSAA